MPSLYEEALLTCLRMRNILSAKMCKIYILVTLVASTAALYRVVSIAHSISTYLLAKMVALRGHVKNVIAACKNENDPGTVEYSSKGSCRMHSIRAK